MFPPGQECVEFFYNQHLIASSCRSRGCFPRAASCKCVWRAWSGRHEVTRAAIWETQYPLLEGSVLFSFRTCSDKLRGPGTSSTRRCRTVCIPYEEKLSTLPLLTVTHFTDPAILQTGDSQLYGNTYWTSISERQNTISMKRKPICLISSIPLPKDTS